MKLKTFIATAALLTLSLPAYAFKCEINGQTVYQQASCPGAVIIPETEIVKPTRASITEAKEYQVSPQAEALKLVAYEIIKADLKDPNSFALLKSEVSGTQKQKQVITEYTATNSFGGRVKTRTAIMFDESNKMTSKLSY
jgi:hypothetical protein